MLKSLDFTLLSLISAAFARADMVVSSTYWPVVSSWLMTLHPTVEKRATAATAESFSEARMAKSSWVSKGEPQLGISEQQEKDPRLTARKVVNGPFGQAAIASSKSAGLLRQLT